MVERVTLSRETAEAFLAEERLRWNAMGVDRKRGCEWV